MRSLVEKRHPRADLGQDWPDRGRRLVRSQRPHRSVLAIPYIGTSRAFAGANSTWRRLRARSRSRDKAELLIAGLKGDAINRRVTDAFLAARPSCGKTSGDLELVSRQAAVGLGPSIRTRPPRRWLRMRGRRSGEMSPSHWAARLVLRHRRRAIVTNLRRSRMSRI